MKVVALGMCVLAGVLWCAGADAGGTPLEVDRIGSFFVGGRQVTLSGLPAKDYVITPGAPPVRFDTDGDFTTGQMYVQFVRLAHPAHALPILFVHQGGITGAMWETKPDGDPGWEEYFLHQGYNVFVPDSVERGRSSWSRFPEIYTSDPMWVSARDNWEIFRFGPPGSYATDPAQRHPYPDTRFPVAFFDEFRKSAVASWFTNGAAAQAAYDKLVDTVCPCIIVAQSSGSPYAFAEALRRPDLVKALVTIEPNGAPDPARTDVTAAARVPHLFVWADNLQASPFWQKLMTAQAFYRAGLLAKGGTADVLDLPARGIRGNSHYPMMDNNSDEIAGMVDEWLGKLNP